MTGHEPLTDLQALVTGAIIGALAVAPDRGLMVDVEPIIDEDGNYTGQIKVKGRESGEELLVLVMTEAFPQSLKAVD